MPAVDHAGPSVPGRLERRRVVVDPARFAAVDRVRGVDGRLRVARLVAGVVAAFVAAALVGAGFGFFAAVEVAAVAAAGPLVVEGALPAGTAGAEVERRGLDAGVPRLRAAAAPAVAVARFVALALAAVEALPDAVARAVVGA